MEEITIIVRRTFNDDSDGSTNTAAKLCKSFEDAQKDILDTLNKEFETDCKTLAHLACLLSDGGINAQVIGTGEGDNFFSWYDNGKGEEYTILQVGEEYSTI